MKRKVFSILFALVLVLSFSLVTAVPVSAATDYYVNGTTGDNSWDGTTATYQGGTTGPKLTIQGAIDDADVVNGDTIDVADGTYTITVAITVNKGVTITGDTSNPENVVVKYSPASTSLNGFEIGAADITIQGVKIIDCFRGVHFDRSDTSSTGCTITNCVFDNIHENAIGEVAAENTTISNNTITNCTQQAIEVRANEASSLANRTEVTGNTISSCSQACIQTYLGKYVYIYNNTINATEDKGINVIRSNATSTSDRIQVIGNTISETKWQGIQVIGAPYTYVYDNTLTKCNYYGADNTGDWDYASIHVQDDTGPTYSDHTIIDSNTVSDGINGIQVWSDNCTITNNDISNMGLTYADTKGTAGVGDGVYYNSAIIVGTNWLTGNSKPTGTTITDNDIYDNYYGLYVRDYATLSPDDPSVLNVTAEDNWWGHKSGPYNATANPDGAGDSVSDNVDFCPWYLVPKDDVGTESSDTKDDYAQGNQAFADGTQVDASGTTGGSTSDITVKTYDYSVPPDAGGALCADASGKRALKYIDIKIANNNYTDGNICITLHYTDADLAAAGIEDESSLSLYYWDSTAWVVAINSYVNTGANTVYGCIPYDKFSGTPICTGGDAEVTGQYEVGGAPEVTVTFTPDEMDPQVEQTVTVNVNVGVGRTLAELTEVKFKLWYDATPTAPSQGEFDAATAHVQTCAIITWNATTFTMTPDPTGNTWSLGTCTAPTLTLSQGDFTLKFTPGTVAKEADGSADNWQLAATATSSYGTGFGYESGSVGAAMNWYGSIALGATVNVDWGPVPAGLAFGDDGLSQESLGTTITYISNGDYDKKAKSSATWVGVTYTATLNAAGTPGSNEFSLKADNETTHADAQLLNSTALSFDATGVLTAEAGDINSSNYLWLKLASTFNEDIYNGTLTYSIANR